MYQGPADSYRQIFWARYVDWFFTTPLLLLDLVLLADGISNLRIAIIMVADVLMILTGLFGAVEARSNKWGWFAFGCIFMFYIFYELAVNVRRGAYARGRQNGERKKAFVSRGGYLKRCFNQLVRLQTTALWA